jgi:glucose-6-phosphate isomerase
MTKGEDRKRAALKEGLSVQELYLGKYEGVVGERIGALASEQFVERLWAKDTSLWKKDTKAQDQIKESLGWLDVPEKMALHVEDVYEFLAEALAAGLKHVVLMGMGGSSLAPLLFERTFSVGDGGMSLTVLDTTDPATILDIERKAPIPETLFVVASKSGTTAEPNAFDEYFFAKADALKEITAGGNFAVITDPGSALETLAKKRCFRGVIHNFKDIGGRYSALSYFGLVPAALMGLDIDKLVLRALRMQQACSFDVPISENPGVTLGAAIGELARQGVDKLTFLMPEAIATLGLWLEQLIAESTGKEGTGILPVAQEPPGKAFDYGDDRVFAYISLKGHPDPSLEALVEELKKMGRPVVAIRLNDLFDLGQEFYRWEIATATAGRILGINPFDQPNVQESKDSTNRLIEEVRTKGKLTEPEPILREGDIAFYADVAGGNGKSVLQEFFGLAAPGDYVALQAYLTESPSVTGPLQEIRIAIRDGLGVATTLGYGPRYLHSTGQFHKGGPNKGLFIQLTADDREDRVIPGTSYTFGILKQAQAAGDLEALKKHGRRIMRVHLGGNVKEGLEQLLKMVKDALPARRG